MTEPRAGRLLVVDDEVELMNALCDILGAHGFDVRGVTNGADALDGLRGRPFDLLLTDLMMPGMDGIQLLRPDKAHDFAEHLLLLIEPAVPLERLADVPIGCMQKPHNVPSRKVGRR